MINQQAAEKSALEQEVVNLRMETVRRGSEVTILQQALHSHSAERSAVPETSGSVRTPSHSPSILPKMSLPEKWNGVDRRCDVFLTNLSHVFCHSLLESQYIPLSKNTKATVKHVRIERKIPTIS